MRVCFAICRWLVLAAAVLLLVAPVAALAQGPTSAAMSGVVLDPDGKAVVDAAVIVRNETSGEIRTLTTDNTGHFRAAGLRPGPYTVEVAVPGFDLLRKNGIEVTERTEDISFQLSVANVTETVTVSAALPAAAVAAPSQASLTARSAQSLISNQYVRNYTSPFSDYSQVLQMAPGTFSVSANGPGLSDTKTYYRGFKDGYYSMMFDGIPFNDTNDPTHHSWVFFPAQTIGSAVFDRSPGSAASIGPSTFGGSVNMLSQPLTADRHFNGTLSYGSFNTKLFDAELDSGRFGAEGKSRLIVEGHDMRSDGYQTYNFQHRDAFSAKYQFAKSDDTVITAFTSVMDLHSNTPDQKGSTRAQIQQFGDDFLMTNDPASPLYYGYNFYHVPTHFEYIGVRTRIARGWTIDDKAYTMGYHNQQNFNSTTTISPTSGTDKLNSYQKIGNILPVQHVSNVGVFRTGLWSEFASTDRYQRPADPRTWAVAPVLPNFHETFGTTTLQPYAEYELRVTNALRITPGVKFAYYQQNFTQFADTKKVGNLNGAASVEHTADYHSWLPSIDAHYLLQQTWSVYAQYGRGQNIPPTSVFDVKGALATLPQPTLSDTYQVGSVWKSRRATLDVDAYRINLQNDYSGTFDPTLNEVVYFVGGNTVSQGVEAESTLLVGGGLALYLNGTAGTAKYSDTHQWVQNAPKDTETIGLTYNRASWNVGLFSKRVGEMFNDNGAVHEAIPIDSFNITNLFVNYTLRGGSRLSQSRIRFAVNNLTDSHAITAVSAASTKTNAPSPNDVLTLMSGRSVSVSLTVGVSGK